MVIEVGVNIQYEDMYMQRIETYSNINACKTFFACSWVKLSISRRLLQWPHCKCWLVKIVPIEDSQLVVVAKCWYLGFVAWDRTFMCVQSLPQPGPRWQDFLLFTCINGWRAKCLYSYCNKWKMAWVYFCFGVVFWTVVAVQRPSRRVHRMRLFSPLNRTEHGSQPSLITSGRELVSLLEVRIEPGHLNPRPLTLQSVTLPTNLRAGW